MNKKIKICDTTWHVMHQTDMYYALRNDVEVDFILNNWRQWQHRDFRAARPIPDNINFADRYEKGKYDVAILHFDQQLVEPLGKTKVYLELNETIQDIPKIVINHGSPVNYQHLKVAGMTNKEAERKCIEIIKEGLGDNTMVVNSHTASTKAEWGFGHPIVHGIKAPKDIDKKKYRKHEDYEKAIKKESWWDLPKEARAFTSLSPAGLADYYNRKCMEDVAQILDDYYGYPLYWAKRNVHTEISFDYYREFLGRSLIYIDTSYRTPMNRARTEAMLSGCCVVQVEGAHDLERWAKNGENIILVPNDPLKIARIVFDLIENHYDDCVKIGQKGKAMAREEFDVERYRQDWLELLNSTIKK